MKWFLLTTFQTNNRMSLVILTLLPWSPDFLVSAWMFCLEAGRKGNFAILGNKERWCLSIISSRFYDQCQLSLKSRCWNTAYICWCLHDVREGVVMVQCWFFGSYGDWLMTKERQWCLVAWCHGMASWTHCSVSGNTPGWCWAESGVSLHPIMPDTAARGQKLWGLFIWGNIHYCGHDVVVSPLIMYRDNARRDQQILGLAF